jgi:hypothetical protein
MLRLARMMDIKGGATVWLGWMHTVRFYFKSHTIILLLFHLTDVTLLIYNYYYYYFTITNL